jgi:hypothetical protein
MSEKGSHMYTGLPVRYRLFLPDFDETWIFEKYCNINFHENPSTGSRVVPCWLMDGRTDRHEEANSRSSQFCEHA